MRKEWTKLSKHVLVTKQRRPHATHHDIDRDSKRDQETRSNSVHTGQAGHCRRSAKDEHRGDNDVGCQTEEHEHQMSECPPSRSDDLQPGVCVRCIQLELRSQLGKQEDLYRRTRGVPPWPGYTISISNCA